MTVEEAIKVVYGIPVTKAQHEALQLLIPELNESEHERIRKSLVEYFRKFKPKDMWDEMFSFGDVLSYLEKQKEAQPGDEDRYMEGYMNGINDALKRAKPAEWSEEDANALMLFHELISFGYTERFCDAQTAEDMRRWLNERLKSLRPQPHWKPSEEQMEALNNIILQGKITYVGQTQDLISLKDELKKL